MLKKQEQIESELRSVIKKAKKGIFVKLSLTNLIEASRRMYVIYNFYKSGNKFKLDSNDETINLLNKINLDFDNLSRKIKKIPVPIKKLLDRKWEKEPNSEESVHGHSSIILKKLIILKKDFSNLSNTLNEDFKNGVILNIDPIPMAIIQSAMTIWVDLLKNKMPKKNNKNISKDLLIFIEQVFEVFDCKEDVSKSFYTWHDINSMN
ncbi:hypothetical protein OAD33_00565 [Alphaproteobacteria bacterium]|nr:hypothetical protein [Alphaproteobacteria bacterium]MDC1209345.1 hypothetical protein [Pseudomonadota bacterium]